MLRMRLYKSIEIHLRSSGGRSSRGAESAVRRDAARLDVSLCCQEADGGLLLTRAMTLLGCLCCLSLAVMRLRCVRANCSEGREPRSDLAVTLHDRVHHLHQAHTRNSEADGRFCLNIKDQHDHYPLINEECQNSVSSQQNTSLHRVHQ